MRPNPSPLRQRGGVGRVIAIASGAALFFLAQLTALGQQAASQTKDGVVTDVAYFYQNRDRFTTPQVVDLTVRVLYYDPGWRVMWVEGNETPLYVKPGTTPMALKAGDQVRLRGTIGIEQGLYAAPEDIVRLGTPGLPDPIPATERLHEFSVLQNRVVSVDAYVDRQQRLDDKRVKLFAVVHGRRIAIQTNDASSDFPSYAGSFVTVKGIYAYTPPVATGPATIEIWAPFASCIQHKDTLANDRRFDIRVSQIERLREVSSTTLVRIVGAVHSQEAGRSITVRDSTGQAQVLTPQTESVSIGTLIEAIGFPTTIGANVVLTGAQYRMLAADGLPGGNQDQGKEAIRFIDQIHLLVPEKVASKPLVAISGVVTWAMPGTDYLYMQDATGGIKVRGRPDQLTNLTFGAVMRVNGHVIRGDSLPEVVLDELQRGADGFIGQPRVLSLDQALAGIAELQWIELTGFLREIQRDGNTLTLYLTTPSGEFTATVPFFQQSSRFLNSVIHVRGVCTLSDGSSESSRVQLLVQSPDDLSVEAALPNDFSALPLQSIDQLNARGVRMELNRWVRTSGLLTLQEPGSYFYLQAGAHSLRVLSREGKTFALGDRIEVVGLLGREGGKQVLREARILSSENPVGQKVAAIEADAEPKRALDGKLVKLTGLVFDRLDRAEQRRVVLQVGGKLVEARFINPSKVSLPADCLPGARAEIQGVYHVEFNDYQQPRTFTLLVRSNDDIVIREPAPWLTLERALAGSGLLALAIVIAVVWVALLRKRVRAQTAEIVAQRDKESRLEAELERSSRLESLGLLAGGIAHDFNNMLTVVVGNITLASMESNQNSRTSELLEEAEKGALRARELTQQLLTFARGGDPVRIPINLATIVREASEFALAGSNIGTEFDFTPNLPPALADKTQLTQAIHNLVLHSSQSMINGGRISFFLRDTRIFDGDIPGLSGGTYLKLSITDTSAGIPAEHLGRIFDPYFQSGPNNNGLGLATVRSIIKRHQGHIAVTSRVQEGTTFTLWIPVAKDEPVPEKPRQVSEEPKKALRVLFMDDDEAIRRFAHNLLTRLGHDASTVSNGTEAVHAYAAAFEVNKPFDAVVLDLTIAGGMGGREALEHLQNIDPNVRAIVSSGYSSDPILSDYRRFGFSGIVSKPYKIADLAQALVDVMAHPPASPPA